MKKKRDREGENCIMRFIASSKDKVEKKVR